jgi:hypothetical protein
LVQVVLLEVQLTAQREQGSEGRDEARLNDARPIRMAQGNLDGAQQRCEQAADDQQQLSKPKAILALERRDVELFEVREESLASRRLCLTRGPGTPARPRAEVAASWTARGISGRGGTAQDASSIGPLGRMALGYLQIAERVNPRQCGLQNARRNGTLDETHQRWGLPAQIFINDHL